jgi:FkbM family methyltransferase
MLQRIQKIAPLLALKVRYPHVVYYGAPSFVKLFGFDCRPAIQGHFSQHGQDALVQREFLGGADEGRFPKTFIDIGCNDPVVHSNSYFFERDCGFRTVAVDALAEIGALWREQRPQADFVECAVGAADGELSFDVVAGDDTASMFSSVSGVSDKKAKVTSLTRTVKVRRIADILAQRGITRAAIVSMDIEGYELNALKGIDFGCFAAGVFVIENNGHAGLGSNEIRDLMIRNGYRYCARIWNLDDIFVHADLLPGGVAR